jgi:UDP-GlcNAc:undecaprenyl-phosphate GlcNAc-1-phosphate transferase
MPSAMLALATALVASFGLTPAARRLALRLGLVDRPGPRKIHFAPIPLLGGLAIYLAAVLAFTFSADRSARAQAIGIIAGATLVWVVGTLDDHGFLHPQIKLMISMPAAALILIFSGIHATIFQSFSLADSPFHPFPGTLLPWQFADYVLTLLWVVGITGAFNILDHMDGLCAFFLFFALQGGQALMGTLAAAVLGASLGFLRWNFNPAKIFMGDGGAVFLGFMMATLGLKLRVLDSPQATSWMIPILILGVPIFDTTLVTISRSRRGLLPFAVPGKDHAAHRLANLGLGHRGTVLALYALGIFFGLLALLVTRLSIGWSYALAAALILIGLAAIAALECAPYERQ